MSELIEVSEARERSGVRLVVTAGVPGPWGEAAKGLLHVNGVPYVRVRQVAAAANDELVAWTGIRNAPQIVSDDEPVIEGWAEMIYFAERHSEATRLIPRDPGDRALMFGLTREIAGEDGFGWCRRLFMLHPVLEGIIGDPPPALAPIALLGDAYRYSPEAGRAAPARLSEIIQLLGDRLESQRAKGSRFLVGDDISALDIYWAAFAAMISPLPHDLCAMPEFLRAQYGQACAPFDDPRTPALLEHRDFIYSDFLELPIQL